MPPRKRTAVYARRRRRRIAAKNHELTPAQWSLLQQVWDGCAHCGEDTRALQRDCILPISRGGSYCQTNVVPACPSCNASKCNDEVTGGCGASVWTSAHSCCATQRFWQR